eukprot:6043218-Pleurochrysis_carterae.AAC.1
MLIANAVATRITLTADEHPTSQPSTSPGERTDAVTASPRVLPSHDEEATATATARPTPAIDDADGSDHELHQHFQRGLGAYPLRNRTPAALLTVRNPRLIPPVGHSGSGSALLASALSTDPKSRKQALRDDRDGRTTAERAEIANHTSNGSWEVIDRSS